MLLLYSWFYTKHQDHSVFYFEKIGLIPGIIKPLPKNTYTLFQIWSQMIQTDNSDFLAKHKLVSEVVRNIFNIITNNFLFSKNMDQIIFSERETPAGQIS